MDNTFGFQEAQKISPIPLAPRDFNISNVLNLYDIHVPEKLPNVDENELILNDIDENFIKIIVTSLRNIFNQMPTFDIPPLFNKQTIDDLDENLQKHVKDILQKSPQQPLVKKDEAQPLVKKDEAQSKENHQPVTTTLKCYQETQTS